jgi:DNA (cytosine-5)-methyltransferase 1
VNKIQVLDLFSGIGGFSLGLERAGFETVAFCEIDKYCRLVLQKHWKDIKIYSDVREIKKERLEADGIPSPDVITGGFPCQPFSVAGRQKGSRDNRYLWPEMFRIIKEFKPRWIIAENVRGIINIQDGVVFEGVHADLESQNYETQTFIIPAAGVGAPHRRDRVWIVANSRRTIRGQQSSRNKESIGSGTSQETKRSADSDSVARSSEREKIMADSKRVYVQGQHDGSGKEQSRRGGWWEVEPNVGRVADGLPGRVHRLKGLGNSIVPQIAEEIGKAILKVDLIDRDSKA